MSIESTEEEKSEEKTAESEKGADEPEKVEADPKPSVKEVKGDKEETKVKAAAKPEEKKVAEEKKESEEKKNVTKAEKVVDSGKKEVTEKNNKGGKGARDEENDGHESPIRLTLEDDDETLHDVEVCTCRVILNLSKKIQVTHEYNSTKAK